MWWSSRVCAVCLEDFLFQVETEMTNYMCNTPKMDSRRVQLIRIGEFSGLIWVNIFMGFRPECLTKYCSLLMALFSSTDNLYLRIQCLGPVT